MSEQQPGQDSTDGQDRADAAEAVTTAGDAKAARGGTEAAAKARLVFRDPLDQQSRDDTDAGWGGRPGAGEGGVRGLDWYLSQRPPHHGD
ncbi:hypothetical protein [Kitasatospora sp. NPDC050463]|uniref:hypothetical protein n=1 Tax=Kitasatospora sp. NPDC050463 TaxID=3155786 RepID=UPI00340927F4